MKRSLLAIVAVGMLVAASCSSRGDDTTETTAPPATDAPVETTAAPAETTVPEGTETTSPDTTEPAAEGPMFGTAASPCGPGEATIAEGQNGGSTLKLGTATDKGFEGSPGLTQEMYDAAVAFAAWCNEQGGVRGLQIEVVDLDGQLFNAPAAIEKACEEVFAMVGGGLVFDDQTFPRFHECGMVDIAAYTVTTTKAMSNGMTQPIPNPSNVKPSTWLEWAAEYRAEDIQNTVLVTGNVATVQIVTQQLEESMEIVGGWNVVGKVEYNSGGEANWAPIAQQVKDLGATAMNFTGQPANLVNLLRSMNEIGYTPALILQEANFYDQSFTVSAGTLADGVIARTAYAPFEEADRYPGMASYLEMMATYNPTGKLAGLGLQATSAYLLFVTAANACIDANGGVLERECMLAEAKKITSWTGHGLHAETNPAERKPPACSLLMVVENGKWTRLWPEIGSADDDGNGYNCGTLGLIELQGDYGDVTAGVDPNRPN
jgi:ABC-type branched-subunit amino acid transport system substrate-binding protein